MSPPNKPFQRITAKDAVPAEWRRYMSENQRVMPGRVWPAWAASIVMFLAAVAAAAEDQNRVPIAGATMIAIEKNAEMARSTFSKLTAIEFDYSEESIKWVDGFINRNRRGDPERMVDVIGSYLGNAIVANFGGRWVNIDGQVAIELEEGVIAFPFAKVEKQFQNGPADSILSFIKVIPILIADEKAKRTSNR